MGKFLRANGFRVASFILGWATLTWGVAALAAPLYFSSGGTWDNGLTQDWGTSSSGPYNVSAWVGGDDAHFLGTPAAVTVSGSIASVATVNFDANGIALSGGTINMTASGGSMNVVSGVQAAINSVVTGTVGLTLAGGGALTLGTGNFYTGNTTISAGTLTFDGTTTSPQITIASGAVLNLNGAISNNANTIFAGAGILRKLGAGQVVWGAPSATFALQAGGLIDIEGGTFVGGSSANEVWTNNLAGLNVAAGAVFSGVEANVVVDALTGSGTVSSGYPGAGYADLTFGENGGSGTFAGVLADGAAAGNFVKAGSGSQTLTGGNTYSGFTAITGGTLQIGGGGSGASIGSTLGVGDNASLVFNHADNVTFARGISGVGSVTQTGAGNLTLTSPNTYSGATNILAGTLLVSNSNAVQNSTVNLKIDNGLQLNAGIGTFNLGGLAGSNLLVLNDTLGSAATLNVGGNGASTTFAGALSGGGSLIKLGSGSLTFSGSNAFGGNLTINGGTVNVSAGYFAPQSQYIGNSAPGSFTLSGGTNALPSAGFLYVGYNAPGSYLLSNGLLSSRSQFVGYTGSGSFTQSGGINVVSPNGLLGIGYLGGNGSYYNLIGGSIFCDDEENIGPNFIGNFVQSGGTNSTANLYLGEDPGGNGSYTLSGGSLYCQSEVIAIDAMGTGTFTQTGGTNTTSSGLALAEVASSTATYNLNGGLLSLNSLVAGSGTAAFNFSGGTFQAASTFSVSAPIVLSGSGGAAFDSNGNTLTINAGLLSGSGGVTKVGAGLMVLGGSQSYTGGTAVTGGTLALLADNASTWFTAGNGGTLIFSTGTFNLNNRYVQALSGDIVEYEGATINGGFLRGPGSHLFPAGMNNNFNATTISIGAVVQQNGPTTFTEVTNRGQLANNAPLTWNAGLNDGGALFNVFNVATVGEWSNAGVIVVAAGGALDNHETDLTSYGGARITVNSGGTLNADSQSEGVALDLQDSLLVNNGTVAGTTNVYYGATVAGSGAFGPINVFQGGTLDIATSASPVVPAVTVSSGSIAGAGLASSPGTLANATIDTPQPTDTLTLSGDLAGAGPLIKSGLGTLILSGTNSYGTGTLVTAGTLEVMNPAGLPDGGNLTVGAGAATLFSAIAPADAAAISPVPEPATLTLLAVASCLAVACRRRFLRRGHAARSGIARRGD